MVLENFEFDDLKRKVTHKKVQFTALAVFILVLVIIVVVLAVHYGNASRKKDESQEQNEVSKRENGNGTTTTMNVTTELVTKVSHSTSINTSYTISSWRWNQRQYREKRNFASYICILIIVECCSFSEILILGGSFRDTMEYYSPTNVEQNYLATQTMITGRHDHVSALMNDGRVLTAGGHDENGEILSSTELFDPRTGRVQAGTGMIERRWGAAVALIADAIYVCGGDNVLGPVSSCERFIWNRWTAVSSMRLKRGGLAMTAVDGELFAIGGWGGTNRLRSVERFDPKSGQWQFVSPMHKGRYHHGAAVLNGLIYVCGGMVGDKNYLQNCERYSQYHKTTNRWETVTAMHKMRSAFNLVMVNGRLYAVGGAQVDAKTSVECYDPNRDEWTVLTEPLIQSRMSASAVVL